MSRQLGLFCLSIVMVVFLSSSAEAQRRGGGRGGFGHSSLNRSSVNRSSMNRPSINRSSLNRSAGNGSAIGSYRGRPSNSLNNARSSLNRPANLSSGSRSLGNLGGNRNRTPSRNSIDSFLGGAPSTGFGSTSRGSGSSWKSKSFETQNGTQITVGGGFGSKTGEGGGKAGAAGKGIRIETSNGKTVARGGLKFGGTNGDGKGVAGGLSGRKASDGRGDSIGKLSGGVVNKQGDFRAGSIAGAKNRWGYAKVGAQGARGNLESGNIRTRAAGAVKGPYGNVISGGRGAYYRNGQFVGGRSWSRVNGAFYRYSYFGPNYYIRYPGAWWPGKWAVATSAWATTSWIIAGAYCGCVGDGIYYDYGDTVTYVDGSVYYEGERVASQEEYYQQANDLADAKLDSNQDEWMPLGVFAVVKSPDQTQTERILQLALNRSGEVRGNFQDLLTEQVTPVSGSVDKKTQRVALKIKGNDSLVMEVGLYNLTNDEVPILIHYSSDNSRDALLVRLQNPEEDESKQ